jgi:ribonuclease E
MLINATRTEEVRAAILHNGKLEQFEIEVQDAGLLKGNVYRGVVANVEASLNACFVDIGADKQGFLPIDEIHPSCYHEKPKKDGKPRIEDVMRKGREIIVQVVKDAVGNKGAALTSHVSLAGRYIVLMPLEDSRGVSRRISDEGRRKKIKEIAAGLKIPEEYGFIVRTAGTNRTKTDLNRDAAHLVRTWREILKTAETGPKAKRTRGKKGRKGRGAALLFEDRDLVVRMIRDYYEPEIGEILIDNSEAFKKAREYIRTVMPRSHKAVTLYEEATPLFTRYRVEEQIEAVFARRVDLPSGGYILIDPTEALTSIDVNSGRSTKAKSQEETALNTNLEAAVEVARQLRLRDIGGLIVVDFIDMPANKQNRAVEKSIKDALKADKARTYISKISDNGLMEVNRQRIKQALQFQTHQPCAVCEGTGTVPTPEFLSLGLLRKLEAKASTGLIDKATVTLHPDAANYVLNNRRRDLIALEDRFGILITVEARQGVHRNQVGISPMSMSQLSDSERYELQQRREALAARLESEEAERREAALFSDEEDAEIEAMLAAEDEAEAEERARIESAAEAERALASPAGRSKARRSRRKLRREAQLAGEVVELEAADDGDDEAEVEAASDSEPAEEKREERGRRKRKRRRRGRGDEERDASDKSSSNDDDDSDDDEPVNGSAPEPAPAAAAELPAVDLAELEAEVPGSSLVPPPSDGLFS